MFSIILAVLASILIGYLMFRWCYREQFAMAAQFDRPYRIPILEHFQVMSFDTEVLLKRLTKLHQLYEIGCVWMGTVLYVSVRDPENIGLILNSKYAVEKALPYKALDLWIGDSILSTPEQKWRKLRKQTVPVFSKPYLRSYFDIFIKQSEQLVENLSTKVNQGEFDARDAISSCTLQSAYETLMGVTLDGPEHEPMKYVSAAKKMNEMAVERLAMLHAHMLWLVNWSHIKTGKILRSFGTKIINAKRLKDREERSIGNDEEPTKSKVLLDIFLENSEGQQLHDNVDTFLFGASENTAASFCFALMMLSMHPEVQDKVVQEIQEILGDSSTPLKFEDMSKFRYMERVFNETMRLFPVGSLLFRQLTGDVKLKDGRIINKGSSVCLGIFALHRNPDVWGPTVMEFDPDRFLPENSVGRNPYSFLAFSGGMRNCIGGLYAMIFMKIMLIHILQNFVIVTKPNMKIDDIRCGIHITLTPIDGFMISVVRRK